MFLITREKQFTNKQNNITLNTVFPQSTMDHHTYQYLYNDAIKALQTGRLLSALQSVQGMAATTKTWALKEEADTIVNAYQMLLTYFAKGTNDPERNKLFHQFRCRTYELAEMLLREGDLKDESTYYYSSLRTIVNKRGPSFTLSECLQPSTPVNEAFDAILTSGAWSVDDASAVTNFFTNNAVCEEQKCLAISATTLSAMKYFDIAKLNILLDQALSRSIKLRVRAMTGLIFVMARFPERLALYPQTYTQLKLMTDNREFQSEIIALQLQIFTSLETKRLERELEEKIIPKMMKHVDTMRIDSSIGLEQLNEKLSENDLNPAWNEQRISPELENCMREYTFLQRNGADLYMGSFKLLKNRFPFFKIASNWFWPFTFNNPDVPDNLKNNKIFKTLISNTLLCDSDKYSFSFVFSQQDYSSLLETDPKLNEIAAKQETDNTPPPNDIEFFKNEMQSYVQGFYRFANLFNHREEFVNPFQTNLSLLESKAFSFICEDNETLVLMADKLFRTKIYDTAQRLYTLCAEKDQNDKIYQKLGFCYEHFNKLQEAYDCYAKANLLAPSTTWTLKRLATCCRSLQRYDEALDCYNQIANIKPEDVNTALHQAECLIHLKRYEEAFKYLFKVNYLAPDSRSSERALAWCSLLTKKYEQAEKYYLRILASNPTNTDYLNAGHSAWLLGNTENAIQRYRKCFSKEKNPDFLKQDTPLLKQAGLTDDEITLMTDAVLLDA